MEVQLSVEPLSADDEHRSRRDQFTVVSDGSRDREADSVDLDDNPGDGQEKRTMTNSSSDHDDSPEGEADDVEVIEEDLAAAVEEDSDVDDGKNEVAAATPTAATKDTYRTKPTKTLRPSDVLSLSARNRVSASKALLNRIDSDRSITSSTTNVIERKRSHGRLGKPPTDERTGFARIYFENQSFTSSTVFKLTPTTTVLEVRKTMANKIKISSLDMAYYVIVVVYPSDNARSLSARTLRNEELILPIVEKLNRVRSSGADGDDSLGPVRPKLKHRSRPALKFILKDIRGAPLDLDEEYTKKEATESPGLTFPAFLGKGIRSGYLQKASVKDPNVWRKRWFVVKDDQLLYCKSATNQRDVTTISLLSAYLAKARPEVKVPFSFELRTPRRIYQLCANSKEDMVAWIHALHVQIGVSGENHRLYEAEIIITEDAVGRHEEKVYSSPLSEPSLLQRVLTREDMLKQFRDFAYSIGAQSLLDTWIECELFRRNCIERETGAMSTPTRANKKSAKEEWDHLKVIIRATETLRTINQDEVALLRQSFQSEQLSRRLSIALHSDANTEYPRVELIASIHQKIFEAIENGPFKQFLLRRGYRVLLERVMGRIV